MPEVDIGISAEVVSIDIEEPSMVIEEPAIDIEVPGIDIAIESVGLADMLKSVTQGATVKLFESRYVEVP